MIDSFFCKSHCSKKSSLITIFRLDESEPSYISLTLSSSFFKESSNILKPGGSKLHLNMTKIRAAPFTMLTKKLRYKKFIVNFRNLNWVIKLSSQPTSNISIDPKTIIPSKYLKFFNVFSCQKSDKILFYKAYIYYILIKKETELFFGSLYNMNYKKNKKLYKYFFDNLDIKFIKADQSSAALLVFFV